MRLIKKGAEANIYLTTWNEKKSILKVRTEKSYRNKILDGRIRTLRTLREAKIISEVKAFGVVTPLVYFVNPKNAEIYMQFIPGRLVRDLSNKMIIRMCKTIGKIVGTLHKNGIMHGDLTTSNFILMAKKLVVLDFGLAERTIRIEDHATDLRLFKEVLNSAHVDIVSDAWSSFLSGYGQVVVGPRKEKVISQVSVIERRGRYANVI